jgi:hypothetical protein
MVEIPPLGPATSYQPDVTKLLNMSCEEMCIVSSQYTTMKHTLHATPTTQQLNC